MAAIVEPDLEEKYLIALLDCPDGIDLAEFSWVDDEQPDGCFRCWDFQWPWYTADEALQADQCSRAVGKSQGIQLRMYAFPFVFPGQEMLVTAPELNHLRPLVDGLEARLFASRLSREMLAKQRGSNGISRVPAWQARFANGSRILSRLPNKDGKGVKGIHATKIELDEGQDYPLAGWTEIIESRNSWVDDSSMWVHGVPKGGRDKFFEITAEGSGYRVHRIMGMQRPSWDENERNERVTQYGGSRQSPDYKRNVYGEHGDATNPLFVLARLMACVDQTASSDYNNDVYYDVAIEGEKLESEDNPDGIDILQLINLPGTHKAGWSEVKKGYPNFYVGMDVGLTNHPSEVLVFGERTSGQLDLLARITLRRVHSDDQMRVVLYLFTHYGQRLRAFAIDRGGLGFPIYQALKRTSVGKRIVGWTFDEKVITEFEDRELERDEEMKDLAIMRPMVEHTSDLLRNEYVDPHRLLLPWDREILNEFQGQTYRVVKSAGSPYGKRSYSEGHFHALDAAKLAVGAKHIPPLEERLTERPRQEVVLDLFVGAG
jgi:hypothetical protein